MNTGHQFANLAFTDSVKKVQEVMGSRERYTRMEEGPQSNHELSDHEAYFIQERDSFYMASVNEDGWPYVQHRGGAPGFIKVLDSQSIGFADFRGNRQYVSVGNFNKDNRVSLFFMDYANKRRLKMFGRVEMIDLEQVALLEQLKDDGYKAKVERGMIIHVEAFDWNCPAHITPRYTEVEMEKLSIV